MKGRGEAVAHRKAVLSGADHHTGSRIHIRALRSTDIPACAKIVSTDQLWKRYDISLGRARAIFKAHRRQDRIYVAVADRHVVGFVWFLLRGTFAHSGYIRWIAVAASAQEQGIGSALMDFAERQLLRAGPNVFLLVSAFNRQAQQFYRRRGYQAIGTISDYVVPGIAERLYRKTRGPLRPL